VDAPLLAAFFYDPSPEFGANPTPFVLMMVAGFVIGVAGHVMRSRSIVALGIGLIFLATFVLPLLVNIARSSS
jgi:uncharacterized membrane protein YedE/YeeE